MNSTYTCQSGSVLTMSIAPFDPAGRLFRAATRELKAVDIEIEGLDLRNLSMAKLADMDIKPNVIKNAILQIVGSESVRDAIHECMVTAPCLYNGQKIANVSQTFNPEDARGDYFGCALEVAVLNLKGFFPQLGSLSSTPSGEKTSSPR